MKRYLSFLSLLGASLLLAACSGGLEPAENAQFSFSVDPAAEAVSLVQGSLVRGDALSALAQDACGGPEPRILTAEDELALTDFSATFLPGNVLEITSSFTNVTDFVFEQPFTFSQAATTRNIVGSVEPAVGAADLGGDDQLSPAESTSVLTFRVEHKGEPFTYEVVAKAVVACGDEEPFVDLAITKEGPEIAEVGERVVYTLRVTNNGTQTATGVEVEDYLYFEEAVLEGRSPYCTYSYGGSDERGTYQEAECRLPNIPAGESVAFSIYAIFNETGEALNRAEVSANEPDANASDNLAEVTTVVAGGTGATRCGPDGVVEGFVTVVTQADLDVLAGCTRIDGSFIVNTDAQTLDFSPLDSLRVITGDFKLADPSAYPLFGQEGEVVNPNLTAVSGFNNLESVGGWYLIDNPELTTLSGFEKLRSAAFETSAFYVIDNPLLTSLPEFNGLRSVVGDFWIFGNDALSSVSGFGALETVATYVDPTGGTILARFDIRNNASLSSISGFEKLNRVEGLFFFILQNPSLTSVSGFTSLTSIDSELSAISDNPAFDCSAPPQSLLPFLPVDESTGNLVNCPTT